MPVTYDNTVKAARLTATRDTVTAGTLLIRNSSNATLATFTLTNPGGTVTNDVWTLAFAAGTVSASAAGTAHNAVIRNSGGTIRISGLTVGTSGADIILDNLSIAVGQSVTLNSATITHAT